MEKIKESEYLNHRLPVQLRFNDIDILGHLNNTVYFSLYDLGKARYFQAVRRGDIDWRKVETVIANVNCSFIEQIRFGENIEVQTRCIRIGEKSFTLEQLLVNTDDGHVKSRCETVMVSIDPLRMETTEVPAEFRAALREYEQNPGL